MSLQDKLDEMRKQFESSAPPEVLTVMHRATADLEKSGIMYNVLKTGDQASYDFARQAGSRGLSIHTSAM